MFLLGPAHPGRRGQRAVKRLCVCVCEWQHITARVMLTVTVMQSETAAVPLVCDVQIHVTSCLAVVICHPWCALATVYQPLCPAGRTVCLICVSVN